MREETIDLPSFSFSIVKKLLSQIKTANEDNSAIYREVKRITQTSTGTIEILDPQILIKLNNVSNELTVSNTFGGRNFRVFELCESTNL